MKKIILLFTALLFIVSSYVAYGQISTEEEPISFRRSIPVLKTGETTYKILPPIDINKLETEDIEDAEKGFPPRFGYRHEVNYNLDNSGEWTILSDSSKIWRLSISCSGALSINLLYDKFWIPNGAKFFVYSNDRKYSIGAFTSENNKGKKDNIRGFATDLIYSDQITLEYYLPSEVKEIGVISIAYVVQGYRYITIKDNGIGYGESKYCNININCPEGENWQNEKNAVALVIVNGNRSCSGSLVNVTVNDNRPLFLTANHCLGGVYNDYKQYDALYNPELDHWSFWWHYESPECINTDEPPIRATVGAVVVANDYWSKSSDFALLRLTEDPIRKIGVTPYYLGWDRSENTASGNVGIHHPRGDVKKISQADSVINVPYKIPWQGIGDEIIPSLPNTHWDVFFYNGLIEGGSSGSPLLNENKRIIGQLHGGSAANCNSDFLYYPYQYSKYYGKFNIGWTGNKDPDYRRRLRDWLDPNNTNVTTLDGKNCDLTLDNKTYSSGTHTLAGCVVTISNTTINTNTTVNVYGKETVILRPDFHAKAGSNVKINAEGQKGKANNNSTYVKITAEDQNGKGNNNSTYSENTIKSLNFSLPQSQVSPKINLYPNPNNGSFNIETNFPLTEIGNLKITNLMGATVYETQKVTSNTIQLQNPAKGTYFVVMILKDGSVLTQKMMVQ